MRLHCMAVVGILTHINLYCCPGPCYYVGSSQGGRSGEMDDNESVIEGKYFDFEVDELFGHDFIYSQFQDDRCN